MYKNYFYLLRQVNELDNLLEDYTLSEAFSQDKNKIVLSFLSGTDGKYLEFNSDPKQASIVLHRDYKKAKKNFLNFFSGYLPSKLINITIAEDDRIIKLHFNHYDLCYLVRGNLTNLILVDNENNLESFKKIQQEAAQNLLQEIKFKTFTSEFKLPEFSEYPSYKELKKDYPYISKEIFAEAEMRRDSDPKKDFKFHLQNSIKDILTSDILLVENETQGILLLVPKAYNILKGNVLGEYSNLSDAVFSLAKKKFHYQRRGNLKRAIAQRLEQKLTSISNKLNSISTKLAIPSKAEEFRKTANLLLANISSIKKGITKIELHDYISNNKTSIPLIDSLNPKGNIQRYFEKARDEEIHRTKLKKLLKQLQAEYNELKKIEDNLNEPEDLLTLNKLMKKLNISENKKADYSSGELLKFKEYIIAQKYHVYVGKDSKSNDLLTTKFAKPNDYWFHARGVSGSHLVLRVDNPKEPIPKNILKSAASIAAFHSKAKTSGLAPVSYALKKYVVKRKGAAAGTVNLLRESVLIVKPEIPSNTEFVVKE